MNKWDLLPNIDSITLNYAGPNQWFIDNNKLKLNWHVKLNKWGSSNPDGSVDNYYTNLDEALLNFYTIEITKED